MLKLFHTVEKIMFIKMSKMVLRKKVIVKITVLRNRLSVITYIAYDSVE